jgi:hypothetical protein
LRAYSLIRSQPYYRADAFLSGLKSVGYEVRANPVGCPGDVLLVWNRYSHWDDIATRFEKQGGTVLVCENGYLGKNGVSPKFDVHPKGPKPDSYYAIGLGFHNDHTRVLASGPERFRELGIELKPWRTDGEHILICPNRSFGRPERMMPADWAGACQKRLQKLTKRPIRVRAHPGNNAPQRPLSEDLKDCWAVYVWSSSVAAHALMAGIPTFIEGPYQILKNASATGSPDEPVCPDREKPFETLANGQFQLREIERGVPFKMLAAAGESKIRADT